MQREIPLKRKKKMNLIPNDSPNLSALVKNCLFFDQTVMKGS